MIKQKRHQEINILLEKLVEEISVSDTKYEEAKNSYETVGEWLSDSNSMLAKYEPKIYPQGSFALGTAIKPINGNDYDVDAVCLLQSDTQSITQQKLKDLVGSRLKEHFTYRKMLDPEEGGRRCWTLKYADSRNFHIDILPAIPDNSIIFNSRTYHHEIDKNKIQITDNTSSEYSTFSNNWHKSNPQGYINWFKKEMEEKIKYHYASVINCSESVDEIPIYKRKTTLQKVIQLLKRHRDLHYGNDENKPISIIITTLATKAYKGEDNILDALKSIIQDLDKFIEKRNSIYWVENPTNPEENFADKWEKMPQKAYIFYEWLNKLNGIVEELLNEKADYMQSIKSAYNYEDIKSNTILPNNSKSQYMSNPLFDVSYREKPSWEIKPLYDVSIDATFKPNIHGDRVEKYYSNGPALPKHGSLQFKLKTNIPKPYSTILQVVNTGEEAAKDNGLRGNYFSSMYIDSDYHRESTLYSGKHMIQVSIIKNGICVGLSPEFVVNIK